MGNKKIIIKEESIAKNREALMLPKFLYQAAQYNETSLGKNDALPEHGEYPFEYTLLKSRLSDVTDMINQFGYAEMSEEDMSNELSRLVNECQEMERPVRDYLEMVCNNAVIDLFEIPDGIVNLESKLVDKVSYENSVRVMPENIEYKFDDSDDAKSCMKAIHKRRLVNALIQGASYFYSNKHSYFAEEILKINKELPKLYNRINILNDYLTFIRKAKIKDGSPKQGSYVEVYVGTPDKVSLIKAQGVVFPLLLREMIRGLFELFSLHGLPSDVHKMKYIMGKADYVMAEPWDMRLGIPMWEIIEKYDINEKLIPYFFLHLVDLETEKFNHYMRELLGQTKKGDEIAEILKEEAMDDKEYFSFADKMSTQKLSTAIIDDSYFSADELDTVSLDTQDDGEII